jgi:predicted GNAT family N-acyltransferase
MIAVDIHVVTNKKELNEVFSIRRAVFVDEQHVPEDLEFDGLDDDAVHVIMYYKKNPVGCARLRIFDAAAKLERIAVLKDYRGKGFGKHITAYLIAYCKTKKIHELTLHSQTYISGFYEKFGFSPKGDMFLEAGLEHIEMRMTI